MEAMHKTVRANQYSLIPFTAVQGSSLRYDTGSHIDLQSLTFLAGLGLGITIDDNSDLSLGIFAEFGDASYDTHNTFAGQGYNGKGSADYSLAGIMARYEYRISQAHALYADASARLGHLHNSYHNNNLSYNGTAARYSLSSTAYGFHLGAGIIMDLTDAISLDLNAKYFYSKIDDASANLSTGESLYFDDLESKRLKLGGLLTFTLNSHVDILAGLTYEREFDGKAQGTTNGHDILSPKLEGNTGIGRLGLSVRPNPQIPLTLELDVAGYAGQREGVTGTGMVKYEF